MGFFIWKLDFRNLFLICSLKDFQSLNMLVVDFRDLVFRIFFYILFFGKFILEILIDQIGFYLVLFEK